MQEKIVLDFGRKKISIEAHVVRGFGRFAGLMFSRRERAKILIFKFSRPVKLTIHSIFVFFPFLAVWLDSDGKVIEIKRVEPFLPHILPSQKFSSLVEVPLNKKNKRITDDIEKFI